MRGLYIQPLQWKSTIPPEAWKNKSQPSRVLRLERGQFITERVHKALKLHSSGSFRAFPPFQSESTFDDTACITLRTSYLSLPGFVGNVNKKGCYMFERHVSVSSWYTRQMLRLLAVSPSSLHPLEKLVLPLSEERRSADFPSYGFEARLRADVLRAGSDIQVENDLARSRWKSRTSAADGLYGPPRSGAKPRWICHSGLWDGPYSLALSPARSTWYTDGISCFEGGEAVWVLNAYNYCWKL